MFEMFSVQWWPFAILTKSMRHEENVTKSFVKNYPASTVLYTGARHRIMEKFQTTGTMLDINKIHQCYALTKMGCQNPHLTGQQNF
jgi:hypothetical protein